MHARVATALALAVISPSTADCQTETKPLSEAANPTIEYASTAAALDALRAKPGVVFTTENGWTIATDEAAWTIWSFAPADYPAYPAVVKRQAIPQGSGSRLEVSVQCEASKSACDQLVRAFAQMNGMTIAE
jgi:hypothetical protein